MLSPNNNLCLAVKNRKPNCKEQCCHKRKEGSDFCGLHSKNISNVMRYDSLFLMEKNNGASISEKDSFPEKRKSTLSISSILAMDPIQAPRKSMIKFVTRYNRDFKSEIDQLSNEELHEFLKEYYVRKKKRKRKKKLNYWK